MNKGSAIIDEQFLKYLTHERQGSKFIYTDERTKMVNGIYHVYPVGISVRQVYICCPFCKEFHSHGNEKGMYTGHVAAHCYDKEFENRNKNGYIIERIPE